MKNDKLIAGVVATIVGFLVIAGLFLPIQSGLFGNSPVDTQFGTKKIAAISWNLSSGTATSTSIYNSDQNDRIIDSSFVSCSGVGTSRTAYTGAGLAALTLRAATTTADSPATLTNTNYAVNYASISTSTPWSYTTSSTEPVLGVYGRVWPSGTYLTFTANATNTATCVVGVNYVAM
jgi:hypothetical protein